MVGQLTRPEKGLLEPNSIGVTVTSRRPPSGGTRLLGLDPELRTSPLPATHVRARTGTNTNPSYATNITNLHRRSHSPHATSCRTTWKVLLIPHGHVPRQPTSLLLRGTFQLFDTPLQRTAVKAPG